MPIGDVLGPELESLATVVVDAIFKVHSKTGAGLLESVYETCLEYELKRSGLRVGRQVPVASVYDDIVLESAFRLDLLVNDQIIVELKAVEKMNPLYDAQVITYLKLTDKRIAFLVNFNVPVIKDGIRRIVR